MKKSDMVRGMLFGAEFFTELHKEVVKLGGSEDNMFEKMKTGSGFAKDVAKLVVSSLKNVLRVLANLSLSDRIVRGKYDWVNSDITQDHFPETIPVDYTVEWKFFHFNRSISSEDAIGEMEKEGFRPATLPELLAFGEAYPNEQKQYPIIALGSLWQHSIGRRYVPALHWGGVRRRLGLLWFEGGWRGSCRFLAVRK